MYLSNEIIEVPKGLTCACGKCDLRKLPVDKVKKFIKDIKIDIVENDIYTADEIFKVIDNRAGEELIK